MYNWTKEEKKIVDSILERYISGELSFDEAAKTAENYKIPVWMYKSYAFDETRRRYNEDFNKYIGKVKKEELEGEFEISKEDKKRMEENPNNISLWKGILDDHQRKYDRYEINLAKYYYRVAKTMIEYGYDDEFLKKNLPLTDEAIKDIWELAIKGENIYKIDPLK